MALSIIWQKNEVFCQETTHYSVVCGAISVHGTSGLHIAQGTITQLNYVEMLEGCLFRQVSGFLTKYFIFSPDGAPCHIGKMSMKWFKTKKV